MNRIANTTAWALSLTLFLAVTATTNLTGLGIGRFPLTFDDVALPRLAVAAIGATVVWAALAYMLSRGNTLSWDHTWAALGLLAAWAAVSAAASRTTLVWLGQSERLEGVVTVFLYALLFGAGLQVGRSQRYLARMAVATTAGAVVVAVHGLLQTVKLDPTNYLVSGYSFYMGSAFATLGNPNFLAGLLVLALPVALALAVRAPAGWRRIALYASVGVVLLALYFTYSQAAWLAALVELAVAIVLRARAGRAGATGEAARRRTLRAAAIAAGVVVLGVVVIVVASAIANRMGLRLWGSSLSETSSGRVLLVQTVAGAVAARPVTGFGPDDFLAAFRLHRPDRFVTVFGTVTTNNAHSWPLQYAATLGIPGALLLLAALALGFVQARPRLSAEENDDGALLRTAIWLGCVGYLVQMLFNVAVIASTVPFWVLLGAAAAPRARKVSLPRPAALALTAACALLALAVLVSSAMLLRADAAFVRSRLVYKGYAQGDAVQLAQQALALNPLSVKYARGIAQARSALVFRAMEDPQASKETVRLLYGDAEAAFARPMSMSGDTDYTSLAWLAGLQAKTGRYLDDKAISEAARQTARRAAALDRSHVEVARILSGDASDGAVGAAVGAPALP